MTPSIFDRHLTYLAGVGTKRAMILAQELGIHTFFDLLHYFPYKYIDRSRIYKIREIHSEMPYIQLRGVLRNWRTEGVGRKQRLIAEFADDTGSVDLLWFRALTQIERMYEVGREYIVFGKPTFFNGSFSISHPEIDDVTKADIVTGGLLPVYTTSEKMKGGGVTNRQLRQLMVNLFNTIAEHLVETLPTHLVASSGMMTYPEAIYQIHFPDNVTVLEQARQRIKFEELLYVQIKLLSLKIERSLVYKGFIFREVGRYFNTLYHEGLPFDLTGAQKRVLRDIRTDVLSGRQMNRLVQGDVGSGKTLVALFAMLLAIDNGYQACMMAPTEILARQHYKGIQELLAPLGLKVVLLIGSTTKRQRADILPQLERGEIPIVIGTHTLIEEGVQFARLGIAVIDEQHRFGVQQRSRLWTKSGETLPHILIMSATPIPRTLAMTLYGDLDVSVIDELPPGRQPISTIHRYETDMSRVYHFLNEQIALGRQAYVVFPMIEESEQADLRDLESGYERYREIFPEWKIGMVHGKMKPKEKEACMERFASGELQLLLATTVIEVGVNVPNASVMVIEGANRFGLSQLHQLRGRVGRGAEQSYCILVTSVKLGEDARRRVEIMTETSDGFVIAEEDMRLRGFGDLEGTRQSGQQITLRIANLAKDGAIVQYARNLAEYILRQDPQLSSPEYAQLRSQLERVYSQSLWGIIS